MSEESTHAVPDDGQEPEQRRNITQKATESSADSAIVPAAPHKRKRDYLPKTPQECARSKILKSGSTPLRERFMADMQYNSLSKTTQKNYLNAVFDFIAHYYKSPKEITDEEIREYFNYEINVRHLSNYSLIVHRAALLFLYEKTLNLPRPFLHIFHPKKEKTHREILTQREIKYFLSLIKNPISRTMAELMYACGLRYSEAAHLTVHDIDRANGYLKIKGKGGTCRKVPIQAKMLTHLERCWQVHRHKELLFPLCEIREATGNVIFSRAKFIPVSKTQALYDNICVEHAIKNKRITPHVFRHCCATHLIELEANPQTVQNILGHKNLRTTTNYIHDSQVSSRRDAEFIEKLSDNLPD